MRGDPGGRKLGKNWMRGEGPRRKRSEESGSERVMKISRTARFKKAWEELNEEEKSVAPRGVRSLAACFDESPL